MRAPRSRYFLHQVNNRRLWQLKKIKILGAVLELPAIELWNTLYLSRVSMIYTQFVAHFKINILTHTLYLRIFEQFSWGWRKKRKKEKSKMADSKKLSFSKPPILKMFLRNFHGLVLGLVFFYEKVLFSTQVSYHLMQKLLKKILKVIYCLAGSSKTAPRILISSIAKGAIPSF